MSTVTVTKTWLAPDGSPETGVVTFRLSSRLTDVSPDTDVVQSLVKVTLDENGAISTALYPGVYTVHEGFGAFPTYTVAITTSGELPTPSGPLPILPPDSILDGGSP